MTKSELIKELDKFDDDSVVIIGDSENGWTNIQMVKSDGCQVSILEDYTHPFSDE